MFPWNIAKSAEALFSRWAIKRVCKFLLKKKLGKFILGDVDLNQLDVQLSAGTVQLSDLALNVDYLNQKFGATAGVFVKEGSIGSMLVTLPWGGNGCGIELDELELVIAPRGGNASYDGSETSTSGQDNNYSGNNESGRVENDAATKEVKITSIDVHEGVKTIANMVKWLLSSFHLRIKKLILAFDPCAVEEKNKRFCRTLVLRIAEVECGTHISEDAHLIHETRENIIGLSWLTNFVKFRGAALEFLQLEDIKEKPHCACTSGTTFGEWFSHCCQSTAMTPIITGKNGGFSGHLKISIPWKNGALDIRKVDADVYVDPLQLKFQPSTALCFMYLWHIFKDMGSSREDQILYKTTESVSDNAASNYHSTMQAPDSLTNDNVPVGNDSSPVKCSSFAAEERRPKALISESHFISDWVGRSQNDKTYVEPDFGASVDHFFECLDELRSSQSALGNSGTWKWTSYISAITAATNLASGSLHIPSVQQHVETKLKVTFANISLLVSFFDEEPVQAYSVRSQARAGPNIHFLEMKFLDLLLVLQVCPEKMNFEATVQHIELDDHFSSSDDILDPRSRADLIQKLQDAVQDALPPSCMSGRQAGVVYSRSCDVDIYTDNVLKVAVLKTSGISQCEVTVNTGTSDNFVLGPTSFTLKLPPFVLWANLGLFNKGLDLLKEIGSCETSHGRNENISSTTHVSSISATESLRGNIFLANARIILMEGYSSFDHLIALDFSYPIFGGQIGEASLPAYVAGSRKGYSLQKSRSLHLSWGDLTACLIVSDPEKYSGTESSSKFNFFAHKILSISDGTDHFSTITMFWQDGALTGPWVTKKAKLLATAENLKNGDRFMGKDYECVSVTNVKEMEDFDNHARQDIVLSSGFFLHAQRSPLTVNLGKIQYDSLIHFVRKLIGCLPSLASDKVNEVSRLSQGSILVECDFVEIAVTMDKIASVNSSIQRELPGSWHSFRLKIKKFELLSVSNLGGVENASFLWVVHGEGSLWGSITGVPHEELLLISCRNSARGRGDGQGSNLLTPRFSGSDIVHLWDPEAFHSYMSFAVRCGTIVATGGRVDWWDTLYSFFTLSSHEVEQEGDNNLQKGGSERSVPFGTSFVLNLADFGVCYEPYKPDYAVHNGSDVVASSITINKAIDEHYFACLLAASSCRLSNTSVPDSSVSEYKIWLQDLGLLLCPVSGPKIVGGSYDVKHLSKAGYVKVAQVAHFEALLRTYCEEDLMWEAESLGLDVVLNTCGDTTSGLIHLGAQLQQLFAPDMEETLVHLQSRWNNVQGANADTVNGTLSDNATPLDSEVNMGMQNNQYLSNLMEEICEDAFQLVGNSDGQSDYNDTDILMPLNENVVGEPSNVNVSGGENFAGCFPFTGSVSVVELESNETVLQHETIPEFIEEYFLSDLRSLSELSLKRELSNDVLCSRTGLVGSGDVLIRDNGWYRNTSLRILENHVSEDLSQTNLQEIKDSGTSSSCTGPDGYGKIKGRILLKNMNVFWRMYGGTDWSKFQKTWTRCSSGRDTTTCLELSLSGMQLQYDFFPDGGICVSSLSLGIQDFCLNDTSKNAPWKLVLGYYESKDHPRKSSSKAFKMDLQSVRPDPLTPLEECRLRVALLPIRLHLHQSQLDFLINFFGGQSVPFKASDDAGDDHEAGKEPRKIVNVGQRTIIEEALLPYFQKFNIWPVLIRVDYSPSHVDLAALRSGKYVELVNIVPWKGVELQLKHVHSVGVYGWSSVCETVLGEWLEDISQNQIHKLLKGLPPIRSLVAVGSGATKLVTLPVKNYKKDRRLLKGVQRGTIAFLRSISVEAIGLGVQLAAGAHNILLQVEYILASIPPSVSSCPLESRGNKNVRSNQPKDALQGMKQACESISGGFRKSASALVRTPLKRYQWGDGIGSALTTAVQAAPVAAIAPASAAARAMHCALLGARNGLDPEHRKESLDKYTSSVQQREFM